MHRKTFVTSSAAAALCAGAASDRAKAANAPALVESDYNLTTATGTIFGTLTLPTSAAATPVALIVAGSGPTDRNGNSAALQLNIYKKLAAALAERGIASVRYDKRGIAASHDAGSNESALRFDTYVDDTVAWLQTLHADKRFASVALVGHSEGSLVGMIAVERAPVASYISLEGAGFPAATVLRTQLSAQLGSSPELLAQTTKILDELEKGNTVADVPPVLAALFRASVQSYLISWFKYDPRQEIAKVGGRVTIVQGTHDIQVSVEDGKALAAANPKATFVLVEGMTHVLSDDPGTTMAEQIKGAYIDSERPLDPRVIEAIVTTIRG